MRGSGLRGQGIVGSGARRMGAAPGGSDLPPMSRAQRTRTFRRIAGFFRPYRLAVSLVLASIVLTALMGVINPYLLKLLIDEAIPNRDLQQLNVLVALMIGIPIMSGLIGVGQTWLNNIVGQHVIRRLAGEGGKRS